MIKWIVMFIVFTIGGLFDYFNVTLIFDKFIFMEKKGDRKHEKIWIGYYFIITYLYCISVAVGIKVFQMICYFLFYTRIIPYLWCQYGRKVKIPIVVVFYELIEETISANFWIIAFYFFKVKDDTWTNIIFTTITTLIFFILLQVALYLRKSDRVNIWFANLDVREYLLLIGTLYVAGNMEVIICFNREYQMYIKIPIMILTILIIAVVGRLITVNEQNYSMENVIEILEKQMKKITGYYSELSEKELELRKFRHDTKNHFLALHSMIADDKKEQALEYINKMETMYSSMTKKFETGNFIADAILTSKQNDARKCQTQIHFTGIIPVSKINDVDMVILISNILDNAIEACGKLEGNKVINIESVYQKQLWMLTVKNPVDKEVEISQNHIATSKEDKNLHGLGIMNMQKVVLEYDGTMKMECTDKEFMIRTVLRIMDKYKTI